MLPVTPPLGKELALSLLREGRGMSMKQKERGTRSPYMAIHVFLFIIALSCFPKMVSHINTKFISEMSVFIWGILITKDNAAGGGGSAPLCTDDRCDSSCSSGLPHLLLTWFKIRPSSGLTGDLRMQV